MPSFAPAQRYSPELEAFAVHMQEANKADKMWASQGIHPDRLNHITQGLPEQDENRPAQYSSVPPPPPWGFAQQYVKADEYGSFGGGYQQSVAQYQGQSDGAGFAKQWRNTTQHPGIGWRYSAGNEAAIYPPSPTSQGYQGQQTLFGQQQYAFNDMAMPYDPLANPQAQLLTQQWHAANQLAARFNPAAQSFTPVNQASRQLQSTFGRPSKSVSPPELNRRTRVNKASRYGGLWDSQHSTLPADFFTQNAVPPPPPSREDADYLSQMGMHGLAQRLKNCKAKPTKKGKKQMSKANAPATQAAQTAYQAAAVPSSLSQPQPSTPPMKGFVRAKNGSQSPKLPHPKLLQRPVPKAAYLKQAERDPAIHGGQPRPLLVILDLNGTLLYRKRASANFVSRPRVQEFLHYLLKNHKVMVWSSSRRDNVQRMCERLFTAEQRQQLVGEWAREELHLTPAQFHQKVQVYKQLSWVWRDHVIASSCVDGREWDQSNTVLIDDSVEKAASEPCNLIQIDEFEGVSMGERNDMLGQVAEYLEVLREVEDVSACMRKAPFSFRTNVEAFDWQPIVNDMH